MVLTPVKHHLIRIDRKWCINLLNLTKKVVFEWTLQDGLSALDQTQMIIVGWAVVAGHRWGELLLYLLLWRLSFKLLIE